MRLFMTMIEFPPLIKGTFIEKINRFIAIVHVNGHVEQVHIPSTGRLDGVLSEGNVCYLKPSNNPKRKTAYSLFIIESSNVKICIDALLANQFAYQLMENEQIEGIKKGKILKEFTLKGDRFDFAIQHEDTIEYIEVKSVNKSDNGIACFPDAPTQRGRKHTQHLIAYQQDSSIQTHILFIVQRNDAEQFTPCEERDPEITQLLKEANRKGVMIHVALTNVTEKSISFDKWLPIHYK